MKTAKDLKLIADQSQLPNEEEKKTIEAIIDLCEKEAKKGKYQIIIYGDLYMPHNFPNLIDSTFQPWCLSNLFIDYLKLKSQLKSLKFNIDTVESNYNPIVVTHYYGKGSRQEVGLIIKWGE